MSVSVIIPCYNRAEILPRAIDSALKQTVPPSEIVVVDDGSTDDSAEIAEQFGGPIRVIRQRNAGAAAARNCGIRDAKGDWIAFLDSDDEWAPTKLARQLEAAAEFPESQLVFCDTVVQNNLDVLLPSRFALGGLYGAEIDTRNGFAQYDRTLFSNMITQSRVITSAVMVRSRLPELQFPEHIWGSEDWALWLKLALRYSFVSVNEKLVTMYQQGDNISSRTAKLFRNNIKVLDDLLQIHELSPSERQNVSDYLRQQRVAAVYYSLISGETREVRHLLSQVDAEDIGWKKLQLYRVASRLPGGLLKRLAHWRLGAES